MRTIVRHVLVVGMVMQFLCGVSFAGGFGGPGHCAGKDGKDARHEAMVKELNLTPEQQEKIEAGRTAHFERMKQVHEALETQRKQLTTALNDPAATRESIQPLVTEMKNLQSQMVDDRINGIFEMKALLTPEQFKKFQEKMERHHGPRGKHGKDEMRGGPGGEGAGPCPPPDMNCPPEPEPEPESEPESGSSPEPASTVEAK